MGALGTANCNLNANFPPIFPLKLQEERRIAPEKRWFVLRKWPFVCNSRYVMQRVWA